MALPLKGDNSSSQFSPSEGHGSSWGHTVHCREYWYVIWNSGRRGGSAFQDGTQQGGTTSPISLAAVDTTEAPAMLRSGSRSSGERIPVEREEELQFIHFLQWEQEQLWGKSCLSWREEAFVAQAA